MLISVSNPAEVSLISSLKIEIRLGAFKNIFFPLLIKLLTFGNNSLTFSARNHKIKLVFYILYYLLSHRIFEFKCTYIITRNKYFTDNIKNQSISFIIFVLLKRYKPKIN